MNNYQAYKQWLNIWGLTDSGRMAIGYQETPFGINIILQNNTVIPYPYNYDESFHYNLLQTKK